jgi:hypothetical protein
MVRLWKAANNLGLCIAHSVVGAGSPRPQTSCLRRLRLRAGKPRSYDVSRNCETRWPESNSFPNFDFWLLVQYARLSFPPIP